ncbi:MAG: InlB B-repeat-containing protein, partial [Lachnospiraceae bacterium]|nr:InlB B-repeat-containing protein [Lachnospiraceae bacterium]
GWDKEVAAVTGAAEYTAKFKPVKRSYEITWKNDDGSVIDVTKAEYGTVPEHAKAEKKATSDYTYEFAGWDKEVVAVTGPAEYTAKFTEKKIESSSNSGSQSSGSDSPAAQEAVNESPAAAAVVDEPAPQQSKKRYKITWKYEDGTKIDATTVEEGQVPVHADPVMEATQEYTYEFIGWDKEPAKVSGPATYTAMFRRIKNVYSVRFESNGGTASAALTAEYGDHINRPAEPEREGYTFEGWYTDEALSHAYNFNEPVVADITVYAKWKEEEKMSLSVLETKAVPAETTAEPAPEKGFNKKLAVGGGVALLLLATAAALLLLRRRNY